MSIDNVTLGNKTCTSKGTPTQSINVSYLLPYDTYEIVAPLHNGKQFTGNKLHTGLKLQNMLSLELYCDL